MLKNINTPQIINLILISILIFILYQFFIFFKDVITLIIFVIFFSFIIKFIITSIDNLRLKNPFLKKFFNFSNDFIAFSLISFFISLILVIILIITPALYSSIKDIASNIIDFLKTTLLLIDKYFLFLKSNLGLENVKLDELYKNIINEANNYIPNLANFLLNLVLNSTKIIGKIILIGILTFYFVRDYDKIIDFYLNIFTKENKQKEELTKIINLIEETISKFIIGQFFAAIYIFTFIFIILFIFKVKNSFIIALLAGTFELVPFIGAFIGFFLSIIFIIPLGIQKLIIFIIYITIVYQLLAKIIYPRFIGKILDISVITVLISLLIGYKIAGITGMFISIPIASIIKKIITKKIYINT
ncbi:MAG: AI-2E family transporter [bacterium]